MCTVHLKIHTLHKYTPYLWQNCVLVSFFLLVSGDIFTLQTQNLPCLELLWTKSFPNKFFQYLHEDLKLAEQVCLVALIESLCDLTSGSGQL